MNKIILPFCFLLALFYTTTATALLPPYYESVKEITAVLNDPNVIQKITSSRMIEAILKTNSGYTLTAGSCTLKIKVNYMPLPNGMVGPAAFKLEVGELEC